MEKADTDKRMKSGLGLRLIIAIGLVVSVTMILFEYLVYASIRRPGQQFGEFLHFHFVHTVVTLGVLLSVIYYIIAKYVLDPVRKLVYALEEMEGGKLVTSLEIKSGDEFEFLAGRFNDMGFKLKKHVQDFVRMEKYRTAMVISKRIVNETKEPRSSLRENVKLLYDLTDKSSLHSRLAGQIYNDFRTMEDKLRELEQIGMPEELDPGVL